MIARDSGMKNPQVDVGTILSMRIGSRLFQRRCQAGGIERFARLRIPDARWQRVGGAPVQARRLAPQPGPAGPGPPRRCGPSVRPGACRASRVAPRRPPASGRGHRGDRTWISTSSCPRSLPTGYAPMPAIRTGIICRSPGSSIRSAPRPGSRPSWTKTATPSSGSPIWASAVPSWARSAWPSFAPSGFIRPLDRARPVLRDRLPALRLGAGRPCGRLDLRGRTHPGRSGPGARREVSGRLQTRFEPAVRMRSAGMRASMRRGGR